ncbi:uncharacterized protein [Penaeus vannamei]|uniref:uncharacterized protein n=1 Tax=Penaeus vannamei TaxID=6689 RepID=UPI00387F7F7E
MMLRTVAIAGGFNLMSHIMNIWERINGSSIRKETVIADEQFGFMSGKGTMGAVFALRQLMKKRREMRQGLHIVLIDLDKAYDRVPRQELWRCMRREWQKKNVRILQDMYGGTRTRVLAQQDGSQLALAYMKGPLFDLIMDVLAEWVKNRLLGA